MKLELWIKYDDGREYIEYRKPGSVVPEDVQLSTLIDSAWRAGNIVVKSKWEYVSEE